MPKISSRKFLNNSVTLHCHYKDEKFSIGIEHSGLATAINELYNSKRLRDSWECSKSGRALCVIKSFSESALWSVVDEAAKMTKAMATSTRKVIVWKCEVGHMVYDPKIKEWKSKYSGGSLMFDKDGLRLTLHAGVFEERVEKLSDTTGRKKFEAVNSKIPRAYYPDIRNVYELDEVPEDSVVIPWQKDKELFLVKKLQEVAESIRSLRVITLAGFQYMIDSREEDGDDR